MNTPAWLLISKRPVLLRFGVAALLVALSTALRVALEGQLGPLVFITYFPAVMMAGWFGGFWPGLFATALSAAVVDAFWLNAPGGVHRNDLIQLLFFVVFCAMMSGLNEFLHRAVVKAQQAKDQFQVTLSSIGDAVIATDGQGQVTFLNPVAEKLTGWPLQTAAGQPVAKVFNIINEQTRKPIADFVTRVIREKKVIGLANHTVLLSREGKETPIEDSAAPIKDVDGNVIGVVIVFYDVAERRKEQEARYHLAAVVESSDDAIVTKSLDGIITSWNQGAERIFGYTAKEVVGRPITILIPPDRTSEEPSILARLRKGERVDHFETVRLRKDGTLLDISLTISPVKDARGNIIGASKVARDITESRKQQKALALSEAELRDFIENANLGLHWVGPDGQILWANKTELKMLGYAPEEYIGHNIAEFHVDPPVIESILKTLSAGKCLDDCEARLRCKDGSIRYGLINSNVLFENGKFVHTRCFTRDITERKKAEEAIRASEERLRLATQTGRVGVWDWDIVANRVTWTDSLYVIHGIKKGDFDGTPEGFKALIHPDEQESVAKAIRASLESGAPFELEFRAVWPDGQIVWLCTSAEVFRDGERPVRMLGATTDITQQKRAERQLEKVVAERTASLQETIGQLEEFSYSVSHDLRSPLRTMQGYATAVLEDFGEKLGPQGKSYLEQIVSAGRRMERLTHDVLAYSRLGREKLPLVPVDLEKLVQDVIREYPHLSAIKEQIRIESPLLPVVGNVGLLTQAVSNLLGNAVKFVPKDRTPQVRMRTEKRGANVRLWVEDNGLGIKPEYHQRIFDLFEQVHPRGQFDGTGIGLAIVRKAVDRSGGKVGVESDGKNGSKFWIDLKAAA